MLVVLMIKPLRSQNGSFNKTLKSLIWESWTERQRTPQFNKKLICFNELLPLFPEAFIILSPLFRLRITASIIRSTQWQAAQMPLMQMR